MSLDVSGSLKRQISFKERVEQGLHKGSPSRVEPAREVLIVSFRPFQYLISPPIQASFTFEVMR
jgi:hypothetical protein